MNVPLLDLRPQLAELRDEIIAKVTEVIDSTRYIQGPEVEALETAVAEYSGVAHGIGVSSGTDALLVSMMALDIGAGDRVLTTPYSFFATMGVILRVGALPVFGDIDPQTYNLDPDQVEQLLSEDTNRNIKAIIPVHLYGQCADMPRFIDISNRYGVPLVEDAAQAIGAELPVANGPEVVWHRAGSLGSVGCFSFFPSKNLGGIGDGGMVVTNDSQLAQRIKLLRNHGAYPKYYHGLVGGNFRLDPIQATVLSIKLKHLEKWHQQRRENGRSYEELFNSFGLENLPVTLPTAIYREGEGAEQHNYHIYNQYVIRAERRDELRTHLANNTIATEIYYPLALHQQECIRDLMKIPDLPVSEQAAKETLALPIYPGLSRDMQEYVVKSIADFYN